MPLKHLCSLVVLLTACSSVKTKQQSLLPSSKYSQSVKLEKEGSLEEAITSYNEQELYLHSVPLLIKQNQIKRACEYLAKADYAYDAACLAWDNKLKEYAKELFKKSGKQYHGALRAQVDNDIESAFELLENGKLFYDAGYLAERKGLKERAKKYFALAAEDAEKHEYYLHASRFYERAGLFLKGAQAARKLGDEQLANQLYSKIERLSQGEATAAHESAKKTRNDNIATIYSKLNCK